MSSLAEQADTLVRQLVVASTNSWGDSLQFVSFCVGTKIGGCAQFHCDLSNCGFVFFPNSVSTLRGSYGKRKGLGARLRCPPWPRVFCVVFAADSCSCLMSKCVSTAQARTK